MERVFKPPRSLVSTPELGAPRRSARRQKIESRVLGHSTADSGTASSTSRSRIYTPTSRLRLGFSIAFFPTGGGAEPPTIPAANVWTAVPCVFDAELKRYASLQNLFTSRQLPDGYEMDSAARRIDLSATLAHISTVLGEWRLVAWWEPNTLVTDEELDRMFADCDLQVQGAPLTLNA